MERDTRMETEKAPNLTSFVLAKRNGQIAEILGDTVSPLDYEAKLAVLDEFDEPYGVADEYFIESEPENLIVFKDNGQTSAEIMTYAINYASSLKLKSIAISTDTIEEVREVIPAISDVLAKDHHISRVGFFFPTKK
jgi:hypothetical protein